MDAIDQKHLGYAVGSLGAVLVDKDRYVFPAGRWHSATARALVDFCVNAQWKASTREEAALAYERQQPDKMVELPSWWEPDVQVVERGIKPYENGKYQYYPLRNAVFHGCAPSTVQTLTVDLATGEERVVDPSMITAMVPKRYTLNLTQHSATPEQRAAGVVDVNDEAREALAALLTFDEVPTPTEIAERAKLLVAFAREQGGANVSEAMIGGAPYFMSALERELQRAGIQPKYAFSKREVVEEVVDGAVKKTTVFRHAGFVSPPSEVTMDAPTLDAGHRVNNPTPTI